MFPYDIDEEEEILLDDEDEIEPKEYEIDFQTGQLTGRIVTGLEAILAWAWLALNTAKYRYVQYSWDYGHEYETLIGKSVDGEHMETSIQAMAEDCLLVNEYIKDVEVIEFSIKDDVTTGKIKIITDYGEGDLDV
ncbi:MAG: DUF2634 domain-containing protein [Clostridiales bacterium]|nr:DUF2634 domain-containing protein [Clostridiales bacterium]